MAVAIIQRFPEGTGAREYDPVSKKLDPASDPPNGLIFHCAGELNGRFEVLDVWESRQSFDRFVEERLIPAQREAMGDSAFAAFPGFEVIEAPVHKHFTALGT
jgi:hypothetical protein